MRKLNVRFAALVVPLLALFFAPSVLAQSTNTAATNLHSLWKVEGKSNVLYLLGSIHLLKADNFPLAPALEKAYSNAQITVFEADISQMQQPTTQLKMLEKSQLPDDQTLKDVLTPATYEAFAKHANASGLPAGLFDTMKPSMAAMMLELLELQKLGMDPEHGVDMHFYEQARADGKPTVALETVDFQIDLVTGLTKEEGELMMKSTLKEVEDAKQHFGEVVKAWETGDSAKLEKLLNEARTDFPKVFKRLVTDRTATWMPKIEDWLKGDKNVLVIVGAGHLVGTGGAVELLLKKGYKITQQ